MQRLIHSISPKHGRALVYVWAIEQDDLSKRSLPVDDQVKTMNGRDVYVPWVLSSQGKKDSKSKDTDNKTGDPQSSDKVFNRYYHMFAQGELTELVRDAAEGLGIRICKQSEGVAAEGIEIVQDGWERSNYYVELRRWQAQ